MNISNDKEAYLLSKIIGELDSEKAGTDFLRKYWITCGKLKYTQKLLGSSFSFEEKETHYVLNVEGLCERLITVLNAFLRAPYCFKTEMGGQVDVSVKQISAELIIQFEKLQTLNLDYGWRKLVEDLSITVCQIESIISRLMVMHSTGKSVNFYTNTRPEDFLNAKYINFKSANNRFFLQKS